MTLTLTVTFPGGDGFTDEIQEWDYNDRGDLTVVTESGDHITVSSNASWFIMREPSEVLR